MPDTLPSKQSTRLFVTAGRMFALACFVVAGYLVLSDSPTGDNAPVESLSLNQASCLSERSAHATRPIETIRVGNRVLATNPEVSASERASRSEPEWERCLHLRLEMPLEPHVDSKDPAILRIELLRPESWVRDRLAFVAGADQTDTPRAAALAAGDETASAGTTGEAIDSVPLSPLRPIFRDIAFASAALSAEGAELVGLTLEMDLPEMGASGTAVVTDLRSCAAVKRGAGQVVTATFSHPPSRQVLDVVFVGESEPVGVTDNHLFWSVDRERFQAIGEMEVGERVQTYHGDTKRIVSKLPRPGLQTVYNLEVYGEHVYFVGEQGLLAHNSYATVPKTGGTGSQYNKRTGQGLYALIDDAGDVGYIGRGDAPARLAKHAQSNTLGEYSQVVLRNNDLTKAKAKGLENILIGRFGGAASVNALTNLRNRIRSFSPFNRNAYKYRTAVSPQELKDVLAVINAARRRAK